MSFSLLYTQVNLLQLFPNLRGAKVRISENNTKQKHFFFVFIVERKYLLAKRKGTNKREQYKTKTFFFVQKGAKRITLLRPSVASV
jgi:hypothetical protein